MQYRKANRLQNFDVQVFRPALVEAKLLTDKHVRDAVYVVGLTKELRSIEAKLEQIEGDLGLSIAPATEAPRDFESGSSESQNAQWIRAKSRDLENRLRRIQQSAKGNVTTVQ